MNDKKAFMVVGHENWGKSFTMNKIRNGKKHSLEIKGIEFWARNMSNDDDTEGFFKYVSKLNHIKRPYAILTLCANFNNEERLTRKSLDVLKNKYKLYFWVIQNSYIGGRVVSPGEIDELKKYGDVEIYQGKENDEVRAKKFNKYIEANI